MKKVVTLFFLFIVLIGTVIAENNWGDINSGENSTVVSDDDLEVQNLTISENFVTGDDELQSSGNSGEWTQDFYIALGVGIIGLLIVGLFIYLFIRGPKNKWKK